MMTTNALAQLRRDYTQAQRHLAFLERCAALPVERQPQTILLATPPWHDRRRTGESGRPGAAASRQHAATGIVRLRGRVSQCVHGETREIRVSFHVP